ncbi:hypothetical protein D3C81_954130 [compost metagenome]
MAHRIGDDFLGAAQQDVGTLRVIDIERFVHLQVDVQRRHPFGQRPQCGNQVDGATFT